MDVAAGQAFAKVVEGSSLAESQLHHNTFQVSGELDRAVEG